MQQVAIQTGKKLVLLELGRYHSAAIQQAFEDLAALECPGIQRLVLDDTHHPGLKDRAWACGDVFCSLSDNIQESFGITPVEAMAHGLPVVVSDWDGYRDSVQHGVQGFLIPTIIPPEGLGLDLAIRHGIGQYNFDHYSAFTSSFVAVDLAATVKALCELVNKPELRLAMGEAGLRRVKSHFDWSVIIPQYEALWQELRARRHFEQVRSQSPVGETTRPARPDPFKLFRGHASQALQFDTSLALQAGLEESTTRLITLLGQGSLNYVDAVLPELQHLNLILRLLIQKPCTALQITQHFPMEQQALVMRALVWMLKVDLLRQL